jgi:hypothetical protein
VENCSQTAFALLHAVNPDADIRVATPGFVQDLYKSMRKGLSQASERNSRSGRHEGSFDTAEGTDYYMKFCGGIQWVMLGCFVGYTLPDMRALGKLCPNEWCDVDTGATQSSGIVASSLIQIDSSIIVFCSSHLQPFTISHTLVRDAKAYVPRAFHETKDPNCVRTSREKET